MAPTTPSDAPVRIVPVPAVNGVLVDSKQRVLLTRRSPHIREPGKWCLPGGHLDGGETWTHAMRRELREEIGIEVTSEKLIGIYSDPSLTLTREVLPEGYRAQFLVASFLVTAFEGEITPNDEVDLWDWFALDSLPEPIMKSHPIRIEDAIRYAGEVFVR